MRFLFKAPRQSDIEVVAALRALIKELVESNYSDPGDQFKILLDTLLGTIEVPDGKNDTNTVGAVILSADSVIATAITLYHRGQHVLKIVREQTGIDTVQFADLPQFKAAFNVNNNDLRAAEIYTKIVSLLRRNLRAAAVDASILAESDTVFGEYRNAQVTVLDSLRKTAEQVIGDVGKRHAEAEKARSERYAALELELRNQLQKERQSLEAQYEAKQSLLAAEQEAHRKKEEEFETLEARYMARQQQKAQLAQLQSWLSEWDLTPGTRRKRWPIMGAYSLFIAGFGWLTCYTAIHSYDLLKSTDDLAKLQLWQWVALSLKSVVPLAVCTSLAGYFINWLSSWAKTHAEEELMIRSRLIDIGRSGWLLEAVRDSHEAQKDLPESLLQELSKNLFSNKSPSDADEHPKALADLFLKLTSLRVKTADGSEIEASRVKK